MNIKKRIKKKKKGKRQIKGLTHIHPKKKKKGLDSQVRHATYQEMGKYVIYVLALPPISFLPSFPPKPAGKKFVGPGGFLSSTFSILCVFFPIPNKGKYHFLSYFPLFIFHPSYFHSNQTEPKMLFNHWHAS